MGWTEAEIGDLRGKTGVVTGANSGIGFETARVLASAGAHVVLACRSPHKGADALAQIRALHPDASVELVPLDLSSLSSVDHAAGVLRRTHPRIDWLINNAGVMLPPLGHTAEGFELQFGTNHLGHFALTARLLASVAASGAGRVVNVSSVAHWPARMDFDNLRAERGYDASRAYAASKLCNLLFTGALARRVAEAKLGVTVVTAHPGWTSTNLLAHNGFMGGLTSAMGMKPIGGARPLLYAATVPTVRPDDYYGPRFLMWGAPARAWRSRRARRRDLADRLWEVSEQAAGPGLPAQADAAPRANALNAAQA